MSTRSLFEAQVKALSVDDMLSYPDIRPCDFDLNFNAWLIRLERWGDIKVTYKFAPLGINKVISKAVFLEQLNDQSLIKRFSSLGVEGNSPVQCTLFREFLDPNKKKVREEYLVEIVKLNVAVDVKNLKLKRR